MATKRKPAARKLTTKRKSTSPDTHGPEGVVDHPTPGTHIWGWCRVPELEWLGEQAARMDSVVEIGSLHGRSAFALLTACPGPVYCIDPWDDEHDQCERSFLSYCGHFPNVRPIRGFSPAAGEDVPNVDMVYIDGAHDRASLTADIEFWLPKTRKLICGHDYTEARGEDAGYPDVKAVVDEMFGRRASVAHDTSIWAVSP